MKKINNSKDASAILFKELHDLDHEEAWVLFLNSDNRLLCKEMVTKGTLSSTPIDARTILRRALLNNAAGIILAHNHPSGNPVPSESDIRQTSTLKSACDLLTVSMLDHIIMTDDAYFSFAENEVCNFSHA